MSDLTLTSSAPATADAKATPRFTTRAATPADLDIIHHELMAVIDESPHYNAEFKAWEKARLTKSYLKMLQRHDPWHVMSLVSDGKVGGALISGPEYGAIFRLWSWIFPSHRQTRLGLHGMRVFDEVWAQGRPIVEPRMFALLPSVRTLFRHVLSWSDTPSLQQFTRTPVPAHSMASERVAASRPPLVSEVRTEGTALSG